MLKESLLKRLIKSCILVLILAVAGTILLTLTFLIPGESISKHIETPGTLDIIKEEKETFIDPETGYKIDVFTDCWMMEEAYYDGEEVGIIKVASSFYYKIPYFSLQDSFYNFHMNAPSREDAEKEMYSRYWHGYLVFLKPALSVLDYSQIRTVNMVLQSLLLAAVLIMLYFRFNRAVLPFFAMILLMAPVTVYKCLQYSSVIYIMLVTILVFLWNPKGKINDSNIFYYFLITGALTSFMDLLTAPSVTLVPLLCIYVLTVYRQDGKLNKAKAFNFLRCAFYWAFGFAAMWIGKWALGYFCKVEGILWWVAQEIELRSSAGDTSRIQSLAVNFNYIIGNKFYNSLMAAYLLTVIFANIKKGYYSKNTLAFSLVFLAIAAIPVMWILVLAEHSEMHCWFTFRTLTPFVFAVALSAGFPDGGRPVKNEKKERKGAE